MGKFFRISFVALCLFACMSATILAQSTTDGAIGGVIKDPSGAVIPNAAVAARNEETNKENTATSDDEGRFRVVQLQPGNYTLTINVSGFAPFTQPKIVVEVGRVTTLDIPLAVTGSSEVVEVTADAPVINTAQQDFSSNINQTSINELPINGRRWSNFALLTPGTVPDGNFGLISFRGIIGQLNNSTIDGGDNNQAFFSEERGRTRIGYSISQSAIREFQVNTSNYSAEYGRAAGGVVNAVTKSGTNEFHGDLFYYQRNNKWGARNPRAFLNTFTPGVGNVVTGIKPRDVRHQFGGGVGGPVVKDRLFFFFSYDQQKRDFPGLGVFSRGDYLNTVNRGTTGTGLKASNRRLTDAQIDQALKFLTDVSGAVPRRGDQTLFLPKIDWRVNDSNTFTATYNRLRWESPAGVQTQATNTRGRASFGDDFVEIDSLTLRLASTLSPTVLNEARFQYGRDNEFQLSQDPLDIEPLTGPGGSSPEVFLTGGLSFGKPTFLERRAFPDETRWQYADTVTVSRGRHTLKFGGDINYVTDLIDNLRNEGGSYSYNNINDFIIDYLNFVTPGGLRNVNCSANATRLAGRCYTSNFIQAFGPTAFEFSTTDYNFFFQDDFRVNPRLTLNLGVRYEYQQLPDPQISNSAFPQTSNFPNDKNNFGPRLGFAYDIGGDGETSVRGGYGIYYGRIINATIFNALANTGVAEAQQQVSVAPTASNSPVFPNVLASAPSGGTTAVNYFVEGFQAPQIHQADLILERQIARNTVVSASYLFSRGNNLVTYVDTNLNPANQTAVVPVVGGPFDGQTVSIPLFTGPRNSAGVVSRPNSNYGGVLEIRDTVRSNYHALVLQANRRLTNGLQFQTSYTLSSARDTNPASDPSVTNAGSQVLNAFDTSLEGGTSNLDVRHKFVGSAVYNPEFFGEDSRVGRAIFNGFTIAPIFSYYSGRPFNGNVSGSVPASYFATGTGSLAGGLNGSGGANRFPLVERNAFRQPSFINVDFRLSRRFRFTETANIEFLAEAFNVFNRTQTTTVNTTFYGFTGNNLVYNSDFGTTNEAGGSIFRERQVQLAVRFQF
ncbi:MAG TPA: carboxypeptidase regulatory-like domain-containing protein [Pyrinomonadaceae bacterium]|nr:carboxypeptidase regulatory-like domain-containing protein [Pyrinomonadaceae bacterium]